MATNQTAQKFAARVPLVGARALPLDRMLRDMPVTLNSGLAQPIVRGNAPKKNKAVVEPARPSKGKKPKVQKPKGKVIEPEEETVPVSELPPAPAPKAGKKQAKKIAGDTPVGEKGTIEERTARKISEPEFLIGDPRGLVLTRRQVTPPPPHQEEESEAPASPAPKATVKTAKAKTKKAGKKK